MRIIIPLLEAKRCWMLDAGWWIEQKKHFLSHPVSSNQHPVSSYFLHQSELQKLDINVKIFAYIDG